MATHRNVHKLGGTFFCTFTCYKWLHLFDAVSGYDLVYDWMRIAQSSSVEFHGYVIMPNHVHVLLSAPAGFDLNRMFSNGKRFMAYEIIKRLEGNGHQDLLKSLQEGVRTSDNGRGQKHRVFRTSTDIRECAYPGMAEQKLDYIHPNPVSGSWSLTKDPNKYEHSSAGFYVGINNKHVELVHFNLASQGPFQETLRE